MCKKTIWLIVSVVTGLGLLFGCAPAQEATSKVTQPALTPIMPTPAPVGEKPKYGGDFTLSVYSDPVSLDPHQGTFFAILAATQLSLNNLVRFDPLEKDYVVEPDLAETWEVSPDGLVYSFRLRKEVRFHNGRDFTSADVKFSIERIRFPAKGQLSSNQALLESIEKVEAPDKYSVVITLRAPSASFMYAISEGHMNIVAKHVVEPLGPRKMTQVEHLVGTGPFILKEVQSGLGWTSVRNPNYWKKGFPYLDRVRYYIIPDASTRFAALRTKRILSDQKSPGLLSPQIELIQERLPEITVGFSVPRSAMTLFLNLRRKPFTDFRVRKAIHLAVDREKVLKLSGGGLGEVTAFMAPGTYWALPRERLHGLPGYRYPKDPDIAEAKRLLTEAGYPDGLDLEITTRKGAKWEDFASVMKEELKKVGIRATIKSLEGTTFFDVYDVRRDFTAMAYMHSPTILEPTGVFSREFLSGSPMNNAGLSHPRVDELILKQERELDKVKRREVSQELEVLLLEEGLSLIPTYSSPRTIPYWKMVKNWPGMAWSYEGNHCEQVWLAE